MKQFEHQEMPEPQVPEFNLEPETLGELQKELFQWQTYNFGEQKDRRMVLGICEEAGELCHAHLKLEQGIRGDRESLLAEAKDAVGDICIYAINLLSNRQGVIPTIRPIDEMTKADDLERIGDAVLSIYCCAARIETARKTVKVSPVRPHPTAPKVTAPIVQHTNELFMMVNSFCALMGWDLERIIRDTWRHVGERDWKRFPKDGKTE